mgnify:CR=1 FL=1
MLGLLMFITLFSQNDTSKNAFVPNGKPMVKVFSNFHFGLTPYNNSSGFELQRAYIGYGYNMSENFSLKANIDVGNPGNESKYEYTAYLKTAALTYKKDKLQVDFGMIGLNQFKLQEKIWGHRYIYKSFMDEHGFGHSADLGVLLKYDLVKDLQVDITLRNGEGYKRTQSDSNYRGAIGSTLTLGDIMLRGVYDITRKEKVQSTISGFLGYKLKNEILAGVEYNVQLNSGFDKDHTLSGISTYASYSISDKFQVFGRFDWLTSNKISGEPGNWNKLEDGTKQIVGIQYQMIKQARIAINFQNWEPDDSTVDNAPFIYISLEFKI